MSSSSSVNIIFLCFCSERFLLQSEKDWLPNYKHRRNDEGICWNNEQNALTFSNTRFRGRVQCCFGARFDFLFLDERCLFMYHKTNLVRTSIFKKFSKLLQGMKSSSIFLISIRLSRHQDLRSQKQKSFVFMRISLKEWKPRWFITKMKKKNTNTLTRDLNQAADLNDQLLTS